MIHNLRTPSPRLFAVAAAVAFISALTLAPTSHAAHHTCGQTVTNSIVLDGDLLNCPFDGLVVGSSGITIDLNGHTVDGVGLGAGIRNNGFDNVTITNGSTNTAGVQEFDHGAVLNPGTLGNIVEKLTIQNNEFSGVELNNADSNNRIRNNIIDQQAHRGVTLTGGSSDNVIVDNSLTGNDGESVLVENSGNNRLEGNQIAGSGDVGLLLEGSSENTVRSNTIGGSSDGAIVLRLGSNDNLLQGNSSTQSADAGLTISDSTGNDILSNTFRDGGDSGIALHSSHGSTITGNDVGANTGGIELSYSNNNLITSNLANDTTGDGISLDHSTDNDLEVNEANRNGSRGIYVVADAAPAAGNLLAGNVTNANQGGGISVSKAVHTLRDNTARHNNSWGIIADPGNVDGGGNRASHNAQTAQCAGVACSP